MKLSFKNEQWAVSTFACMASFAVEQINWYGKLYVYYCKVTYQTKEFDFHFSLSLFDNVMSGDFFIFFSERWSAGGSFTSFVLLRSPYLKQEMVFIIIFIFISIIIIIIIIVIFICERWSALGCFCFCSFTLALSQAGKGLQGSNISSPVIK